MMGVMNGSMLIIIEARSLSWIQPGTSLRSLTLSEYRPVDRDLEAKAPLLNRCKKKWLIYLQNKRLQCIGWLTDIAGIIL